MKRAGLSLPYRLITVTALRGPSPTIAMPHISVFDAEPHAQPPSTRAAALWLAQSEPLSAHTRVAAMVSGRCARHRTGGSKRSTGQAFMATRHDIGLHGDTTRHRPAATRQRHALWDVEHSWYGHAAAASPRASAVTAKRLLQSAALPECSSHPRRPQCEDGRQGRYKGDQPRLLQELEASFGHGGPPRVVPIPCRLSRARCVRISSLCPSHRAGHKLRSASFPRVLRPAHARPPSTPRAIRNIGCLGPCRRPSPTDRSMAAHPGGSRGSRPSAPRPHAARGGRACATSPASRAAPHAREAAWRKCGVSVSVCVCVRAVCARAGFADRVGEVAGCGGIF